MLNKVLTDSSGYVTDPNNGTKYTSVEAARQNGVIFNSDGTVQYSQPSVPAPVAPPPTQNSIYSKAAGYVGNSISDFLKVAGQPNDYNSRKALAGTYGIANYTGSAAQNTQLLNILKGFATNNTTPTGIPNSIAQTGPVPGSASSPIPASAISTGDTALDKILNAAAAKGTIDSDIAGLLALSASDTESVKKYDELGTQLTDLMGSLGNEGADLQAELDRQGVSGNFDKVKELNLKAGQLKGELESFDAETVKGTAGIDNRTATESSNNNNARQFQQDRDLTRIGKAAELSATIALSQAYQGNAELGLELAGKAVDLKYQPILARIDVIKTQLGFAETKMNAEEKKRASVVSALLSLRQNEIENEKATQKEIQTVAIQAAANGAPLSVVNQMKAAPDAASAAVIGSAYIKGNQEKIGGTGPAADKEIKFTFGPDNVRQLVSLGLSQADINNLQADIASHGIDQALAGLPENIRTQAKKIVGGATYSQLNETDDNKQFLSADFFKTQYGSSLDKAAFDAGFTKKVGGGLFGSGFAAKKGPDTDAYLKDLMTRVDQYRKAGYKDQDILKMMQ